MYNYYSEPKQIDLDLGITSLYGIDYAISDNGSCLHFPSSVHDSNLGLQARLLVSEIFRPSPTLNLCGRPTWLPGFFGEADVYPEMIRLRYLAKKIGEDRCQLSQLELEQILRKED